MVVADTTLPRMISLNGLHGPNARLTEWRAALDHPSACPADFWAQVHNSRATWLKLLWPEHTRCDAALARAFGLRVIVRAPGEHLVADADLATMIREFAGVADALEVGNEPNAQCHSDPDLWVHAWYLDNAYQRNYAAAAAAHLTLIAPGWTGQANPPVAGSSLATRLQTVYGRFDAQAVHAYDSFTLASSLQLARLATWHAWTNKPIYVTEYGIAARYLTPGTDQPASDLEKVRRYVTYLRQLAPLPYVQAAMIFIVGGTSDFAAFSSGGYDPRGNNSYWLSADAYRLLGTLLTPS